MNDTPHHKLLTNRYCKPDPNNPWDDDKLGRKPVAEKLTDLIKTYTDQSLVMSVSSSFGGGKTHFLERWRYDLINQGYQSFYINAWQSDYAEQPLLAFINAINEAINKNFKGDAEKLKPLKEAVKILGKQTLLNGIKKFTGGIINLEELIEKTEQLADREIESHEKMSKAIECFKQQLSEHKHDKFPDKPIVIFIDELDRCRPDYAIDFLETIKHIFDINGYVFILGIDREQLKSSASALFGEKLDGDNYLRKFIDFDYPLPAPNYFDYAKYLYDDVYQLGSILERHDDVLFIVDIFAATAALLKLSLREQDQIFGQLNFFMRITPPHNSVISLLTCLLMVFREKNHELYQQYGTTGDAQTVLSYLEELKKNQRADNKRIYFLFFIIKWADAFKNNSLQNYQESLKEIFLSTANDPEHIAAKRVYERFNGYIPRDAVHNENIVNRVYDMIEQFFAKLT